MEVTRGGSQGFSTPVFSSTSQGYCNPGEWKRGSDLVYYPSPHGAGDGESRPGPAVPMGTSPSSLVTVVQEDPVATRCLGTSATLETYPPPLCSKWADTSHVRGLVEAR